MLKLDRTLRYAPSAVTPCCRLHLRGDSVQRPRGRCSGARPAGAPCFRIQYRTRPLRFPLLGTHQDLRAGEGSRQSDTPFGRYVLWSLHYLYVVDDGFAFPAPQTEHIRDERIRLPPVRCAAVWMLDGCNAQWCAVLGLPNWTSSDKQQ